MLNDPLSNTMSAMLNSEKIGKDYCTVKITSSIIEKVLEILNKHGYLGSFEKIKASAGNELKIYMIGKINNCGAIKPRFSMQFDEIEKFEKRFLPAKGFGILVMSTSQGMMTNEEAKKKKIGGKLVAYCY